jgi:hypothetical protein
LDIETKVSIVVALVLILTAFLLPLRVAAGLATVYLLVYGILRLRKRRQSQG